MNKKDKLIPEIRFPEFKNKEDWKVKSIDELCDVLNNIRKPISSSDRKKGTYPYYGASGIIDYVDNFLFEERLLLIGEDGAKWGAYENTAFLVDGKYWVNNHAHVLKPSLINDKLLESYLVKLDLHPYITGAAPPKLTLGKLKEIPIPFSENKIEQEKIASCLSSLDETIKNNSQKLSLLKEHKKGLMQNLFPQEGEKVPKYRFKEFENDADWVEDILFSLANNGFSNGVFNDPKKVGRGYKLINVINMYSESPISENNLTLLELSQSEFEKNKVEYGDIFFTRSSLVPEGIAKSNIYLGSSDDITYDGHLIRMRPKNELITSIFLHYLLKTDNVRRQMIAKGKTATMTTIGQSDVASVEISYSKNPQEQQKIASCLSSLDSLITAQAEKIEQLKLHKKGLMQGLFPKIIEN